MTTDAIGLIFDVLTDNQINYEFERWSKEDIPETYWIGEFSEIEPANEDGLHEATFMLTGTTRGSWLGLLNQKEKIEQLFPSINEKCYQLDNGSMVAVIYQTALLIPTDTLDLKRVQINLNIKEWMVN